mmetsp:Transcript_120451/g.257173  ORF Transcript_120451/g.257173 Transcript_120451/m.257173 type:complete len:482 (+) Transcript_120451:1338-2783(+)
MSLRQVEANREIVRLELLRSLVEGDGFPGIFAAGVQVGVGQVNVHGRVRIHGMVLHHALERPLRKIQLAPMGEDHTDTVGGVVGVLLMPQRPREVMKGPDHVRVALLAVRLRRARDLEVEVPYVDLHVVELLRASALDRNLRARNRLWVVMLVPVDLSLHKGGEDGILLHGLLEPLHSAFYLAHPLPLRAEAQERVGIPVVLLVQRHVVPCGLGVVEAITQAFCQPCLVEAHREACDMQILRLLRADRALAAAEALLHELEAAAIGLLCAGGVAVQPPQSAQVVPHLWSPQSLRGVTAILEEPRNVLIGIDAHLGRQIGLLGSELVVGLRTHGPGLEVVLGLLHEGVCAGHCLLALIPMHEVGESEELEYLRNVSPLLPHSLQGRDGLLGPPQLHTGLRQAVDAGPVLRLQLPALAVLLQSLSVLALRMREAAILVVHLRTNLWGPCRGQRPLQQGARQFPWSRPTIAVLAAVGSIGSVLL